MKRAISALIGAAIIAVTMAAAEARPHHKRHHHQVHHVKKKVGKVRHQRYRVVQPQVQQEPSFFGGFHAGFSVGSGVVAEARQYIGATARQVGVRSTLWCSAFLRKITGASGVDDQALSWEKKPSIAPQVGAIVTMGRRGGGHVGVVSGFTPKGDPIVISGNHRGRVAESVYRRSRIRAWVSAS